MNEIKDLLRVADIATALGVTPNRAYQLLRARVIPSVRIGGAIRIPRVAWEEWLRDQCDRSLKSVRREESPSLDVAD